MKDKNIKVSYLIALFSVILVVAISLIVSKDKGQIENIKTPDDFVEEEGGIPAVMSFNKLYQLLGLDISNELTSEENNIQENTITNELDINNEVSNTIEETENENLVSNNELINEEVLEPTKEFEKIEGEYTYYVLENIFYIATESNNGLKTISKLDFSSTENETIKINETYVKEDSIIVVYTKNILNNVESSKNIFTVAEIYSTKNKRKPKFEREVQVEGEYLSSINLENSLFLLSNKKFNIGDYYGLAIENIDENDFKIMYSDTNFEEEKYISFDKMYYFDEKEYTTYLNIVGIDLNEELETFANTYLGTGDEIYLYNSGLYIVKTIYDYKDTSIYGYYNNLNITSYIYKFIYEQNRINFYKIGNVQGDIFEKIDEFNNTIRIITEDSTTWESFTKINDLYILNSELEIIGTMMNFAENEKLSKIEFLENTLNVETILNETKHYKFDLSEPTNIKMVLE